MSDHALLAVVPSIHRVEWACQAWENGCDAFLDFLAVAFRMEEVLLARTVMRFFRREQRRGQCAIVRRARCGNSGRAGEHPLAAAGQPEVGKLEGAHVESVRVALAPRLEDLAQHRAVGILCAHRARRGRVSNG